MRSTTPTLTLTGIVCGSRELTSSLFAVDIKITKTIKDHHFTATGSLIFRNRDLLFEAKKLKEGDLIQVKTEPGPVTYEKKTGEKVFKIDFTVKELAILSEPKDNIPMNEPTRKVQKERTEDDNDISVDDLLV